MRLSLSNIKNINNSVMEVPPHKLSVLPEKVLQFGTGLLSRGIPDYFIDKANKQGLFNGRIVLASNSPYADTAFQEQDCLFTQLSRGVVDGIKTEEKSINTSISRILFAKEQWQEILACAVNPEMQFIIVDTAEENIALDLLDSINAVPPVSFPCKLLAFLLARYAHFQGDPTKGMVIIPAELVPDNGVRLEAIILELAHLNNVDADFMDWLENSNYFCHSLIDRIIPATNPAVRQPVEKELGYNDDLMVIGETFCSWAIETNNPEVNEKLSFAKADDRVIVSEDIEVYRQLKLRLLNGIHTYTCGLSFLAGLETVKAAMENEVMREYIERLMLEEIAPSIPYDINQNEILNFAHHVLDRFNNPFVEHNWLSIAFQYSAKMKIRNVGVLLQHYYDSSIVPQRMALGFAAHILFMKCEEENGRYFGSVNGKKYQVIDDNAALYANYWREQDITLVVNAVLSNVDLWDEDLTELPGFKQAVEYWLETLLQGDILNSIKQIKSVKQVA